MVLFRSLECWGYAALEQAWKYMSTQCCISFLPCRSIRKEIWPCHKNGQGQSMVIIWTNLVVLEYLMLYTKFQCHRPLGSEEGDFLRFYHKWARKPSWSCDPEQLNTSSFPTSHGGSIWNLASNGPVLKFENVESELPWTKVNRWPWPCQKY